MPAPNRVTPRSEIVAVAARGLFMGNRGCLHRAGRLVRTHAGRRWITCETSFRGRRVPQWAEGRYTVLFFHDEAVALAAGHRPCAECRRARYLDYRERWAAALGGASPSADALDAHLHRERWADGAQRTSTAPWASLPPGAFAAVDDGPVLVLGDRLLPWTPGGYGPPVRRPAGGRAVVLTPPASVAVLRAGYEPVLALGPT